MHYNSINSIGDPNKTDSEFYRIYEYDDQGYMVHAEHWYKADGNWEQTTTTSWSYESNTNKWTRTIKGKWGETIDELHHHTIGTTEDYMLRSYSSVNITCDPYPDGTPDTVFNAEFTEINEIDETGHPSHRVDWYSASYIYDETGNAVRIESYSIDGTLLGVCELEYDVIRIDTK